MGDLITMSHAIRPSRAVIAASGNADILFFTGVRYSRMPDEMRAHEVLPNEVLAPQSATKSTKSNKTKKIAAPHNETLQG